MNRKTIKLLIADDHEIFRTGLKNVLRLDKHIEVSGEAGNGLSVVELARQLKPDVILMDIVMPGMNGIDATKLMAKEMPAIKIIALTMFDEESMVIDMLDAGATGYLMKNTNRKELIEAIDTVLNHKPYFSDEITEKITRIVTNQSHSPIEIPPSSFTEREKEIMRFICDEYTTKEIAYRLKLSSRTVEGHRLRIMDKIGAKSIAGIITYAVRSGIYSMKRIAGSKL